MLNEKIIWPKKGRYIVGVSGGADSMVLLDVLRNNPKYELIVAHFDHNMRPDSVVDSEFVEATAKAYGLEFITSRSATKLASESTARDARYEFLSSAVDKYQADGIITAHHLDDLIETSILNLTRGTNFIGLVPMQKANIIRPLLGVSRKELRDYADRHNIRWREDPTNSDQSNPRNFLRNGLIQAGPHDWGQRYLNILDKLKTEIDILEGITGDIIKTDIKKTPNGYEIPRDLSSRLSNEELELVLSDIIKRIEPSIELNQRLIMELAHFIKIGKPKRFRPVSKNIRITQQRDATLIDKLY
jgi:tRNA(Ile)-lysidine synthase